jgi:hypothetical protein
MSFPHDPDIRLFLLHSKGVAEKRVQGKRRLEVIWFKYSLGDILVMIIKGSDPTVHSKLT